MMMQMFICMTAGKKHSYIKYIRGASLSLLSVDILYCWLIVKSRPIHAFFITQLLSYSINPYAQAMFKRNEDSGLFCLICSLTTNLSELAFDQYQFVWTQSIVIPTNIQFIPFIKYGASRHRKKGFWPWWKAPTLWRKDIYITFLPQ